MFHTRLITRLSALATVLAALGLLATAAPASAVIDGTFDGNRHPNVGATNYGCSGVLISPRYFATAAHCVKDPLDAGVKPTDFLVTFASDFSASNIKIYHVLDVHYDPGFAGLATGAANGHDLGVLHLAEAVKGITPASLPPLHSLDSLVNNGAHPALESVGYGTEGFDANQPFPLTGKRNYADTFISSDQNVYADRYLKVSAKHGGLCYGDSGGPTFLGTDDTTALSLTSIFHSSRCQAWMYTTRLDTQVAHDFYAPYD